LNVPTPKAGPDLKSVSPSQIKEFLLCKRKHWLNKRCGIPQPEGDHLAVGTAAHAGMEGYFESGVLFDPATHAAKYHPRLQDDIRTAMQSALQLLKDEDAPKPKPGLLIEQPRSYATGLKIAGVALRQRSDLLDPTDKSVAKSYDWKTSARVFSDFSKTGEELSRDPQGILYAWEAFEKFSPDAVIFAHGVLGTKEVEFDLIPTDPMSREHVGNEVMALAETVHEMREHFAIDNFHQTKPGKGAPSAAWGSPCRAFKGCPYAELCGVDLTSTKSTPTQDSPVANLSFRERLAQAKLATGINPPDAAPPPAVVPYVPPVTTATAPPEAGTATSTVPPTVRVIIERMEADLSALKALVVGL
jgi:hypothetical protein